jgi:hypothetical protein
MTQKKQTKMNKRRTQVKDLPKEQQELSKDEQKKVKGGVLALNIVDVAANRPK